MLITEVVESDLPLYLVETQHADGTWNQWCAEPFATEEEAGRRMALILQEYGKKPTDKDRIRVGRYTVEHWRRNLVKAVLMNEKAAERAVGVLSNGVLVCILQEVM